MKNEKADGLRQRWKRNRREIRGTIAVLVALLVATGTAVSLFLTAFAQTKTTYCGQKHEHTIACYSNPKADVETANKWEATLPKSDDDTPRVSKLVDVVRSQVGYQESKDNYAVEGDDLHGYTRYGAWEGGPYEPWNTTFVNFCLHYAGIDINVFSSKTVSETEESTQEDDAVAEEDDQEQNDVPEQGIELEQSDELEEYAAPQEDVPMAEDEQSEDTSWYADVQWDDDNQDAPDETEDEEASNAAWAEDMQWDDEPQDANASEETANDAEAANDDESADDAGSQAKPAKAPRSADEWKDRLTDAGLYVAPKEAKPHAGDMVFLCQPDDEDAKDATVGNKAKSGKDDDEDKSDRAVSEIQISADEVAGTDNDARSGADTKALRVAIVTDVNTKKDLICVVEGDSHDAVEETWYSANDPEIVGYGTMPVELRDEVEAYKKLVAERKKAEKEAAKKAVEEEAARKAEEEAAKKAAEEAAAKKAAEEEAARKAEEEARKAEEEARKAAEEAAAQLEAEAKEVPQVLFAEVDGYGIKANLGGEAQEGYTLWVKPLKATKKRLAAVEEGLTQELSDGATKQAHVDADDVVLFDISVRDKDDNEVELSKKVRITVTQLEDGGEATASGETSALQTPDVVHLADEGTEVLNAKPKDDGFTFTTKSLSPFAFVFTVDFEYQGYEWSMPGKGSALLSQVLEQLHVGGFTIADVTDATFSNPKLVEVTQQDNDGKRDWLLTSKKPFTSNETLTLTLASGDTATIDVTDEGDDSQTPSTDVNGQSSNENNISKFLSLVEFFDGDVLMGNSDSPDSMVARPGHEYTMRLHFKEDEDTDGMQFPDSGEMEYIIPDRIRLSPRAFKQDDQGNYYINFDISLGRKLTLTGNTVYYVPKDADGNTMGHAYLKIKWNDQLKDEYKELIRSPRTAFMLSFPYTTIDGEGSNPIMFSSTVDLDVEKDSSYSVQLEKRATPRENDLETMDYEVIATADGDVEDIVFTDEMGAALNYLGSSSFPATAPPDGYGLTVEYRNANDPDTPVPANTYASDNISEYTKDGNESESHGFSLKIAKLNGGHQAVFKYSAHVNYALLGGKDNIETTSRNTVRAKDKNDNLLAEAFSTIDKNIDYLQVGKSRGTVEYKDAEGHTISREAAATDWGYMNVEWTVIYNPDRQIDVEGARLTDTVWKGKKFATTYDTTLPFTVTAYESGTYTKDAGADGDKFEADGVGIPINDPADENNGWTNVAVTDYEKPNQLSSWDYTIPAKAGSMDPAKHYTYVIKYWTRIDNNAESGGYVGNQVVEHIADITRDRSVHLPGVGPDYDIEVEKTHIKDDYVKVNAGKANETTEVYSQWEIKFDRQGGNERALVEDTLPHYKIDGRIHTDTFMSNTHDPSAKTEDHGWEIVELRADGTEVRWNPATITTGTGQDAVTEQVARVGDPSNVNSETCVPKVSLDMYDVVFWFYTKYTDKDHDSLTNPNVSNPNIEGLSSSLNNKGTIIIRFWTKNDSVWIDKTAEGKAPNEHWNHVHLVLDGKEAVHKAYGVPKPDTNLEKRYEKVGSWTTTLDGGVTVTLPVYRYTLTLNGVTDDAFVNDQLVISDEYNSILTYLPANQLPAATGDNDKTGTIEIDGKQYSVTLDNRSDTDERLVRTLPVTVETSSGSGTGESTTTITRASWDLDSLTLGEVTSRTEKNKETGEYETTQVRPITIKANKADDMKYTVLKEDGTPLRNDSGDGAEVRVYGKSYEVSYYLAPNPAEVRRLAQEMVDPPRDYTHTSIPLKNVATWTSTDGEAIANEAEVKFDYPLNPVNKTLLSYDSSTETAKYMIEVNPLQLTMNGGQRYSVTDEYENLAVDFSTVQFVTVPAGREKDIEWSYHNNKGVFWVPDETKVTITYEGWPVGRRSNTEMKFSNKAAIEDYVDNAGGDVMLSVDHEGLASSYRVRIFKFSDDNMDRPLYGSVFQLFETDAAGNKVPMKYRSDFGVSEGSSTAFGDYPADDDDAWSLISESDAQYADMLNEHGFIPTPERHYAGDNIYFITGMHNEASNDVASNGIPFKTADSDQIGFAEIVLNQSQDGISLKMNKQYYLREVLEPTGHIKENVDWQFIIAESDDFDNYVYSNDSILQVSNASADRVLTVRKDYIDRTWDGKLSDQKGSFDYDFVGDTEFEVVGRDSNNQVIYNKTVTYNDFMRVDTPLEGGGYKREWLFIIRELPAGNYTVREVRQTAEVENTDLVTFVDGNSSTTHIDPTTKLPIANTTESRAVTTPGVEQTSGDTVFGFTVYDQAPSGADHLVHTNAEANFTNIYTDEDSVSLTVDKRWNDGGKTGEFTPKSAEFELYADGEKYNVTKADCIYANENGNIEIPVPDGSTAPWANEADINYLPRNKSVNGVKTPIEWTVKEVGATYTTVSHAGTSHTVTADDIYLKEHFSTTVNGVAVSESGNAFDEDNDAEFTNTFNNITTVRVTKTWSDSTATEGHEAVDHSSDSVYFDLYRTTTPIDSFDAANLRTLATAQGAELVKKGIKLSASNDSSNFTYENGLLEKKNNVGDDYYYFVLESSVAGYTDTYTSFEVTEGQGQNQEVIGQGIAITNTPVPETGPKGNLTITKNVAVSGGTSITPSNKFQFTLWNSGKYLKRNNDGTISLVDTPYAFEATVGADGKATISDVPLGTYVLREVEESAKIGGYTLESTTVTVDGVTASARDGGYEVVVTAATTPEATEQNPDPEPTKNEVVVTNTYTKDVTEPTTDYSFGKLWAMPNELNTTTLPWPENTSITMVVRKRIKGQPASDADTVVGTYTFTKGTDNAITSSDDTIQIDNPDDTSANSGQSGSEGTGTGDDSQSGDQSAQEPMDYHHYTFTIKDLPKYDTNGDEWEYYAVETEVTSADNKDLLDEDNDTGKYYTQSYGYVDGIGLSVRYVTDEDGNPILDDDDNPIPTTDAITVNGVVGYAINRLQINQEVEVNVKKFINGWSSWRDKNEQGTYPSFTFTLFDAEGHAITREVEDPVTHEITTEQISATTTDGDGKASFSIPDTAMDPNQMIWWSDEQVLYGRQYFWIREGENPAPAAASGELDNTYEYYGITNYKGSVKVALTVKYDWLTGELKSEAQLADSSYTYPPKESDDQSQPLQWAVVNNTYDPEETPITVKKTWDDDDNQDGYRRPVKFKVNAKYWVGNGKGDTGDNNEFQTLNKVWSVETVKVGSKKTKVQKEIILNTTDPEETEYRITLDPSKDELQKTVKLPKYFEGHNIIYSVEEVPEESEIETGVTLDDKYKKSDTTISDGKHNVTNTHTTETVSVAATKSWVHNGHQLTDNPTIQLQLVATYKKDDGTQVRIDSTTFATTPSAYPVWDSYKSSFDPKQENVPSTDSTNTFEWSGLPRYAPGEHGRLVTYTVEEVPGSIPVGYHQSAYDDNNHAQTEDAQNKGKFSQDISITNTYEFVSIPIEKVWDDDDDRDHLRGTSAQASFELSATIDGSTNIIGQLTHKDGSSIANSVVLQNNTWTSDAWSNLPKYYQGQAITYKVTETTTGLDGVAANQYQSDSPKSSAADSPNIAEVGTITNTHKLFATKITLTKTWDDEHNRDGRRPTPDEFIRSFLEFSGNLQAAGTSVQLTLGDEKDPEEGQQSNVHIYELKNGDDVIKDAEVRTEENDITGEDTFDTYVITFTVPRYRADSAGRTAADEVAYSLKENDFTGSQSKYERVVPQDETLPSDGSIAIGEYTSQSTEGDKTASASVANRHELEYINITATKNWNHGSNSSHEETPQATVTLVAKSNSGIVIDEQSEWAALGSRYANIQPTQVLTGDFVSSGETGTVGNGDNGNNAGQTTTQAYYTWEDLPTHMPGQVDDPITYSIREDEVPIGYHMVSNPGSIAAKDHADQSVTISLTNVYEETQVTATKVWDDGHNQDNLRKPVQFELWQRVGSSGSYQKVAGKTSDVSTSNPSDVTWNKLPAWINNTRVYYKVVEIPDHDNEGTSLKDYLLGYNEPNGNPVVEGFANPSEPTVDGTDRTYNVSGSVTNTHVPATESLSFQKTWDHKGVTFHHNAQAADDPRRPENYITKLHLWAREEGDTSNATLKEVSDNNWAPVLVDNNDWQSHASIDKNYNVTITDLPLYKPLANEGDTPTKLEYFISEDVIPNYHLDSSTTAVEHDSNKLIQLDAASPVTFKNERDTGTLAISKSVVSDLANDHSVDFSFIVTTNPAINSLGSGYEYTITNPLAGQSASGYVVFKNGISTAPIKLKGNQTITITGLPVGVTYTVTEASNANFTTKVGDTQTFIWEHALNAANDAGAVTFTNTRKLGTLSINKSVSSTLSDDKSKDFQFTVELEDLTALTTGETKVFVGVKTAADGTTTASKDITFTRVGETSAYTGSFSLKAGESIGFSGLPSGATYAVTETAADHFTTTQTGNAGTISATSAGTASFTNTRDAGNLTITKSLTNAIPDDDEDTFFFDAQLKSGDAVLALDPAKVSQIKVGKTVLTTTSSDNRPYYDTSSHTIKNIPVKLGAGTTITGLPQGTTCEVTEQRVATPSNEMETSNITIDSAPRSVAINGASQSVGPFTNTRATGGLKITKDVNSPVDAEHDAAYTINIALLTEYGAKPVAVTNAGLAWDNVATQSGQKPTSLSFGTDGTAELTLYKGETVTISGIPTDVVYTVTEPGYDLFDKQFVIDSTSPSTASPNSASAEVKAGTQNIYTTEITNTRKLGDLTVGKTVASSVASDKGKYYKFTVTFHPPVGDSAQITSIAHDHGVTITDNTATFSLKDGETKQITNLPIGWTYSVVEEEVNPSAPLPLSDFTTTWTRTIGDPVKETASSSAGTSTTAFPATSGASNSIVADPSAVQYTNTRKTGELKIDKTLFRSIPDDQGDVFYFNVELKYNGENLSYDSLAPIKVNGSNVTEFKENTDTTNQIYYDKSTGKLMNVPVTLSTQSHGLTTITGIPLDATYGVVENTADGFMPNNISRAIGQTTDATGSITATAKTAGFTNTRAVYQMEIKKEVEQNGPVPADESADYTVEITLKTKKGTTVGGIDALLASTRSQNSLDNPTTIHFDENGKYRATVSGGHSVYIGEIPTEVICTVNEIDANDRFDEQYASTNYASSSNSVEIQNKNLHTVTITNSRRTGSLTVKKAVESTVAGDKSHQYHFEVELLQLDGQPVEIRDGTYGDMAFVRDATSGTSKATFTLTGNVQTNSVTATGLPTGLTYKVTEVGTDDEGTFLSNFASTWTRKVGTANPTTPVSPDNRVFQSNGNVIALDTSTVTATNTRKTDTLTLSKSLVNAIPTDEGDTFYFNVRLRGDDVQSGQTEGQPLALDANAPITVKSGNNSWTLNTTSNDHPYYDATEGIIRNVPVVWHAATQTSSAGGTTTIEGLPWGATYTVAEVSVNTPITGNPGNITNATSKTNDTGTITDTTLSQNADANTASFQNTRKTGSLSINKHVVSPVTQEKASTYAYSVEVQLNTTHKVGGENKSVSEFTPTFTRTNGDTTTDYENPPAFDQDGKATITLHQDETVTISGIPTDVTYTVTEPNTNPEYFNKTYGIYNSDTHKYVDTTHQYASGGIPTNDTAKTQVINTRKLGDLVVSKAVNSAVASDKTHNYHFKVELTSPVSGQTLDAGKYTGDNGMEFRSGNDANTAEFDLCDQGRKTATGLPVGWTYTVTESASTGSGAADLSKFNTTWTKTVTANGSGTTTDEDNGSGYACPVSSASGGSGQTQTTYSIEEDTTSAIEFLNTRKTGQLQLTKTVRSPFGKEKDATYQFKVSLQMPANGGTPEPITYAFDATNCTGNTVQFSQGVATINVQGRQDRPVVISGLPIDAEYAVTEVVNDTNTFEVGAAQYNKIVSTSTTPVADNRASHVIEENVTYGAAVTNTRTKVPVSILKVSATYVGTKLEGAVFTLTAPDDNDLRTRLGWTTKELVSDAQGYLCENGGTKRFELLPSDGLYTLEEVKAPLGYHKLAQAATFKVTPDGVVYTDSIHPQNCVETNDSDTPANRVVHVNVANSTGTELPSTGGLGTTAIYAAGCTLIALAGLSALRRRKA